MYGDRITSQGVRGIGDTVMRLSPELLRLQFRLCAVWELRGESCGIITPRVSSLGKGSLTGTKI